MAKQTEDEAQAVAAQAAEAAGGDTVAVDFGGHTYEVGQPTAKALEYLAEWQINDRNLALVLAVKEMVGQSQWDAWCGRHAPSELGAFFVALEAAQAPN